MHVYVIGLFSNEFNAGLFLLFTCFNICLVFSFCVVNRSVNATSWQIQKRKRESSIKTNKRDLKANDCEKKSWVEFIWIQVEKSMFIEKIWQRFRFVQIVFFLQFTNQNIQNCTYILFDSAFVLFFVRFIFLFWLRVKIFAFFFFIFSSQSECEFWWCIGDGNVGSAVAVVAAAAVLIQWFKCDFEFSFSPFEYSSCFSSTFCVFKH